MSRQIDLHPANRTSLRYQRRLRRRAEALPGSRGWHGENAVRSGSAFVHCLETTATQNLSGPCEFGGRGSTETSSAIARANARSSAPRSRLHHASRRPLSSAHLRDAIDRDRIEANRRQGSGSRGAATAIGAQSWMSVRARRPVRTHRVRAGPSRPRVCPRWRVTRSRASTSEIRNGVTACNPRQAGMLLTSSTSQRPSASRIKSTPA